MEGDCRRGDQGGGEEVIQIHTRQWGRLVGGRDQRERRKGPALATSEMHWAEEGWMRGEFYLRDCRACWGRCRLLTEEKSYACILLSLTC